MFLKKLTIRPHISSTKLIVLTALFWMAFANFSLFGALLKDYPLNGDNALFLAIITFGFTTVIILILSLFCFKGTIKPVLISLLIGTAMAAYFMDTYNVLIDDMMISTTLETDTKEALDLISPSMFVYLLLLGVFPALFVLRAEIKFRPFLREVTTRVLLNGALVSIFLVLIFMQSAIAASFFREHKSIRYYANPTSYIYGIGKQGRNAWRKLQGETPLVRIAEDAYIPETDRQRELVILVVGETARADRFSLNGYQKPTNPLLEKQNVVSFSNVQSCATLTAISVPCMFSRNGVDDFDVKKARNEENILDILARVNAKVLWRDNNSSSKGVADRVLYEDYRDPTNNPICDIECRDVGMLVGLQEFIDGQPNGDIIIVLHQMGNHGPAYYKRYPKEFEVFTPACQTNELGNCSSIELDNAYDNAILYTDYFLNNVIELLKNNTDEFETLMLYVGDHGESLGEGGLYLHGMPNFLAPRAQRHVPMIVWAGTEFDGITVDSLRAKKDMALTHDYLFHTLLGLMEVQTAAYDQEFDFLKK